LYTKTQIIIHLT